MNKLTRGAWIMILSVFVAAPLFAAGEREEMKAMNAGTADQSAVQKTIKPDETDKSTVPADEQPAKVTAENPYTAKKPKLIAVQDLTQQKDAGSSPALPAVERKSTPIVISATSDSKQQPPARSLQKKSPVQKKTDVSSLKQPVDKSKDISRNKKYQAETGQAELKAPNDKHVLKKEAAKANKILKVAMRYYRTCDFEAAEENVSRCLAFAPDNQAALTLKSKIENIREKTEEMRIDLAEQCYYRAEGYKREGNVLDAMALAQKAFQLNPRQEKARVLFRALSETNEEIVESLQGADRVRFKEAVVEFLEEDFSAAAGILRPLQSHCPQLTNMLAVAEVHSSDKVNRLRSREYYASALKNIYKERYLKAQEDLYLSLEMDKNNLDAKQKLLLVNQELGTQRISAVGQE